MKHRIRRQVLELDLPRAEGARAMAQEASRLFQEKVLPELDVIFSRLAPADRYISIDRLEIDLSRIPERDFERQFVEECLTQLDRQVSQLIKEFESSGATSQINVQAAPEKSLAIFADFLRTGTLPWHAKNQPLRKLEAALQPLITTEQPTLINVLQKLVLENMVVLKRLHWQFSTAFTLKVIALLIGVKPQQMRMFFALIEEALVVPLTSAQRLIVLEAIIKNPPRTMIDAEQKWKFVVTWLQQTPAWSVIAPAIKVDAYPDSIKKKIKKKQESENQVEQQQVKKEEPLIKRLEDKPSKSLLGPEGLSVENAGIVLLAPYLFAFFKNLSVVPETETPTSAYRAIHLLHFLATGSENPEEPQLILPKLLCGLSVEDPVPQGLSLTDTEKTESENLLQAVIRNWPVLKNTTSEGLRSAFLQREGLIYAKEDSEDLRLTVERKSQDLLLERLPWGYAMIKFPWNDYLINVEW